MPVTRCAASKKAADSPAVAAIDDCMLCNSSAIFVENRDPEESNSVSPGPKEGKAPPPNFLLFAVKERLREHTR
jgi:hypothetical protein